GDDLDIRLHAQQQGQRAAHHALVLGEQDPDDVPTGAGSASSGSSGRSTASRNPPPGCAPALTAPPATAIRSVSPRNPLPGAAADAGRPAPSSVTSTVARPSARRTSIRQCRAPLCRITFVTASRTAQASSASTWTGSGATAVRTLAPMPASASAS